MNSLTVPIGLPIEIKKSGAPDTQGLILQEFKYPFVAKKYNFSREQQDEFAISSYKKSQRAQIEGIFKSEISPVNIKDKKGLEDEWYANIEFIYPPRSRPSLQDGFINSIAWKDEKDMSGELLTKVKRNNKIMVEFKGSSIISRAD